MSIFFASPFLSLLIFLVVLILSVCSFFLLSVVLSFSSLLFCLIFYPFSSNNVHLPPFLFLLEFFSSPPVSHDPAVWPNSQYASRCEAVWCNEPMRVSQSSARSPRPDRLSATDELWFVCAHAGVGMWMWLPAIPALPLWRVCVTVSVCCETNGECVFWHCVPMWVA